MMTRKSFDHLIIRCPSLGGEVPFSYCRKQGGGIPCPRLPGCWADRMNIDSYIKSFFSHEEIAAFFQQVPQGRIDTFLLSLERVSNMQKEHRERLIAAIHEAAPEGKITCSQATQLADEHQFSRREMGNLLNELEIKIKSCQLGCF